MQTSITFVRHGTTLWMEEGRIHGKMDAPLSESGKAVVADRAQLLTGRTYNHFYCSPTGRAVETAAIIAPRVAKNPIVLEQLYELDFGNLEGELKDKVAEKIDSKRAKLLGWFKPFGTGGETLFQLFIRCRRVLRGLLNQHQGEAILVVSHGIFINMAVRILTKQYFMYFDLQPVGIVTMSVNRYGKGKIVSIE